MMRYMRIEMSIITPSCQLSIPLNLGGVKVNEEEKLLELKLIYVDFLQMTHLK